MFCLYVGLVLALVLLLTCKQFYAPTIQVSADSSTILPSLQTTLLSLSVCRGRKVNFNVYDRFVIRHACSLPFHQKDQVTGEVFMRWSRVQNHHFHVMRSCIIKDPHDRYFAGNVSVEDSVQVNQTQIGRASCRERV